MREGLRPYAPPPYVANSGGPVAVKMCTETPAGAPLQLGHPGGDVAVAGVLVRVSRALGDAHHSFVSFPAGRSPRPPPAR